MFGLSHLPSFMVTRRQRTVNEVIHGQSTIIVITRNRTKVHKNTIFFKCVEIQLDVNDDAGHGNWVK